MLHAEAQQLHDQYDSHDTDDFLRRLAVRIAQDAARSPRIARAVRGIATRYDKTAESYQAAVTLASLLMWA
ncbi:hypothetical protein AB0O68_35695 [Streptomyces sp. NPDC087512]|uniref:hypothetical protein n=1 Tax=Streptomyces sp. NPDC087512 TaxID=3155059 RepID=UPI003412A885